MSASSEVAEGALKAAPPVTFAALHIGGVSLPDWVAIAALIYTVMQIVNLAWRWSRGWLNHSRRPHNGPE